MPPSALLRHLFDTAIRAAHPDQFLSSHLAGLAPPKGRLAILAAGKAATAMAAAVVRLRQGLPIGAAPLTGVAVTKHGAAVGVGDDRVRVIEAGHPVPDQASAKGGRALMELAAGLTQDDLALCLLSGGASALIALPPRGIGLSALRALNADLLRSGAAIDEMNAVRKHVSGIAGGRLAAAAFPAPILTLAVSDVPGDRIDIIGSGPTCADPSMREEAHAILERYGITPDPAIGAWLASPDSETPKPGDPRFASASVTLAMTPGQAIDAAAGQAARLGYGVTRLGDHVQGEAAEVARTHAALALELQRCGFRGLILSGGELTVTLPAGGTGARGGPNQEYALALALALSGAEGIHALAGDTDGQDGSDPVAGAMIGPDTLRIAAEQGIDLPACLAGHQSYDAFQALGQHVITGPTQTNVNDFRIILVS